MGQFWKALRQASQVVSQVFNGLPTNQGREATPMQRAWATGHTTGYNVANFWEQLRHDTSWNHVATNAIALQWAQASITVYDRSREVQKSHAQDSPSEQRTPIQNHPVVKLLKRPNPVMGFHVWMIQAAKQYKLTGTVVVWEVKDQEGKPAELWILPRAWLSFMPPTAQYPMGLWRVVNPRGMTGYWGNNPIAGGFYLDVRETIQVNWPHSLYPGEPYSALEGCSKILDIGEKADEATWYAFKQAPQPGMILSVDSDGPIGPDQITDIERQVAQTKSGVENTGKTMVLQNVSLAGNLGTKVSDLNPVEVRNQAQAMAHAIHGVPPIGSGIAAEVGTYSGNAATINTWIELGIQPHLDIFAGALTHRWQRVWGDDFELEFSAKRFDDPTLDQKRADQLFAGIDKQAATVNEWRAAMKLPPIPGGDVMKEPPQPPMSNVMLHGLNGGAGGESPKPDMADDLPSDDNTGVKRPELQQSSGNRLPAFLLNGSANGVPH